jgi:hypothetical protein
MTTEQVFKQRIFYGLSDRAAGFRLAVPIFLGITTLQVMVIIDLKLLYSGLRP